MATTTSRSGAAPLLVSPRDLQNLSKGSVVALDASWYMPNAKRDTLDEFKGRRIPDARHLDLDQVASDHELGLKHMMPSSQAFASFCEQAGIEPTSHVILYDTAGVFSSPRALFMFRAFGHENSSVLDGGLPCWEDEGLPVETKPPTDIERSSYPPPAMDQSVIRDYEQMVQNSLMGLPSTGSLAEIVVDARSAGRYAGTDPEPRPGLSSGHIPHSYSLPFNVFLQTKEASSGLKYTKFATPDEVRAALIRSLGQDNADRVLNGQSAITTTCGSGMTAAILWLGLKMLNVEKIGLYDESWTGYAMRKTSKIDRSG